MLGRVLVWFSSLIGMVWSLKSLLCVCVYMQHVVMFICESLLCQTKSLTHQSKGSHFYTQVCRVMAQPISNGSLSHWIMHLGISFPHLKASGLITLASQKKKKTHLLKALNGLEMSLLGATGQNCFTWVLAPAPVCMDGPFACQIAFLLLRRYKAKYTETNAQGFLTLQGWKLCRAAGFSDVH